MCVDKSTGIKTFTDISCPDKRTGEHIPSGYAISTAHLSEKKNTQGGDKHRSSSQHLAKNWETENAEAATKEERRKPAQNSASRE